jgi:hypothetical protein
VLTPRVASASWSSIWALTSSPTPKVKMRVPAELRQDPVLLGECLAGALYTEDFRRLLADVGCADARAVRGRSAFERDMDDEMRFHLENRTAVLVARGRRSYRRRRHSHQRRAGLQRLSRASRFR